ncbi:hypothetical protein [Nocardia cyriacigeorgica]|uniref:hypothetical protein n=1 Tax=Nocardia cyriacigeorgica TaxID=135487 RepID=UPI0024537961|nr:hypothetical protein [Nocardia cyriacigeorgica]
MTSPTPYDGLSTWKLRLLARIQKTSADHARVLRSGYPEYQPHYGAGDIPIQTWRTHLRAIAADLGDMTAHAAAVDIPSRVISEALAAGARGELWGDSVHTPPALAHGESEVWAHMVDGVASDIWQLEHMAVLRVEHTARGLDARVSAGEIADFDVNMESLRARATMTADAIALPERDRAEIWDRTRDGWQRLAEATVFGYSDTELHERWRTMAWPGLAFEARRDLDTLTATTLGHPPSTREQLIIHAGEVIADANANYAPPPLFGEAIAASVGEGLAAHWADPDPGFAGEPIDPTPRADPPGHEP